MEGVRNANAPDPHWDAERCAVTTRRQDKTEGQTIPLKVAEEVDLAVINPEKLKELQEADPTLHRYRNKEEPVMMRGKQITFVTRKGILYRQCETQADEKPVLQVVVPGYLRRQIMQLAHDSILGAHLGTGKTLSRIQAVFYWPDMGGDVARFCRSCDIIMSAHHQQGQNTKSSPSEDATDRPTLQESGCGSGSTDFSPK